MTGSDSCCLVSAQIWALLTTAADATAEASDEAVVLLLLHHSKIFGAKAATASDGLSLIAAHFRRLPFAFFPLTSFLISTTLQLALSTSSLPFK